MQNDKAKFKIEFKKRDYAFVLKLIEFIDGLPKDNVSRRSGDQLLRSGTSILGNYVEGQGRKLQKRSQTTLKLISHSSPPYESKLWLALLRAQAS